MARIAIVGPGAIGSAIAAQLHAGGRHEIILCARRPIAGLRVHTPERDIAFAPRVLTDPAGAGPVDWVLVCTKAYDAAGAAAWMRPLCAGGAPAAILQNGVEHRERFAPLVGAAGLVPVVVDLPAERAATLTVTQRGPGVVTVCDDARGRAFAALFAGTAVRAVTTPDFTTAAWRKLCVNAPGILPAILRQPARIFRDDGIAAAARTLADECARVGCAEGARLPADLPDAVVAGYQAAPGDSVNSLHADVLAGRPTELDARNGAIVRFGRRHGIPTPSNELAIALLAAAVSGGGPGAPGA